MAKEKDWRAESRDYRIRLQHLAKQEVAELAMPELRDLECHEDSRIAARAADEITRRNSDPVERQRERLAALRAASTQ